MIKAGVLRTASFSLAFLLVFAPAHAQAANSGTASDAPSPLSAIAHDFTTWLNHAAGHHGANNRRGGRHASPSPRPAAALASTPAAPNKQWSEFITPPDASKKTTPVQIND
jgi:hypothetical protein